MATQTKEKDVKTTVKLRQVTAKKKVAMEESISDKGHCNDGVESTAMTVKPEKLTLNEQNSTDHVDSQEDLKSQSESNEKSTWSFDDAELTLEKVDINTGYAKSRGIINLAEDIILNNNFTDLELDTIKDLMKKKLKLNKGTLDKVIQAAQVGATEEGEDASYWTHWKIAKNYIEKYLPKPPEAVGTEGAVWLYIFTSGLYEKYLLTKIENEIGRHFPGKNCKKGSDYTAIARLVYHQLFCDDFFNTAPYGVAAKTSFIRIADDLSIKYEQYSPKHRQRYKLPVDPIQKNAPLFLKYLQDSFAGQDYKQNTALVQQIMGGLVTGIFNKLQKAVLLFGSGNNGKSVFLELLEHMFPQGLKCAVSPSDFDNQYYKAVLAGKIINIVGELDGTRPLTSAFKDVIGCDTPISARMIYKEPFEFKPRAGHIFASNHFPQTNDHTHGFYRRWIIVCFNNTVSDRKKIPNLGAKIATEELPQVLAWALQGAERLAQNKFILPFTQSHEAALEKWQNTKNSVFSFLGDTDVVERITGSRTPKKIAYAAYRTWCLGMGVKAVGYHEFNERGSLKFREVKRSGGRRSFDEMRLKE